MRRPVWEDAVNINGGKWIVRLKKGVADRIWEDIVMAIIGDQFDECNVPSVVDGTSEEREEDELNGSGKILSMSSNSDPEICGCTLSVRESEDILSIWNKDGTDSKVRQKIRYVRHLNACFSTTYSRTTQRYDTEDTEPPPLNRNGV